MQLSDYTTDVDKLQKAIDIMNNDDGTHTEQFIWFYGTGSNGKTTYINTIFPNRFTIPLSANADNRILNDDYGRLRTIPFICYEQDDEYNHSEIVANIKAFIDFPGFEYKPVVIETNELPLFNTNEHLIVHFDKTF